MSLSREQIDALLKTVSLTRDRELDCDACLRDLAEFAERSLQGKSISDGLRAVEQHLAVCSECREEYQALRIALGGEELAD